MMRLNWCLKFAPGIDVATQPIGLEKYITEYGLDLYMTDIIQTYKAMLLNGNSNPKSFANAQYLNSLFDFLKKNSRPMFIGSRSEEALWHLWLGNSTTAYFYKDVGPYRNTNVRKGDLLFRIEYLGTDKDFKAHKFELFLSRYPYADICPLEYYYKTHDIPELDILGS